VSSYHRESERKCEREIERERENSEVRVTKVCFNYTSICISLWRGWLNRKQNEKELLNVKYGKTAAAAT
jgi:hypothetical protein